MSQKILSVDSQILNSICKCARFTKLTFIDHLAPIEKAEPLERGELIHKMLELYYSWLLPDFKIENWLQVNGCELVLQGDNRVDDCLRLGEFLARPMNLGVEECMEVLENFKEYCDFWKDDGWIPISVEEVGSRVLYEDVNLKIIYNFKVDLIAERRNLTLFWDHKSSKRRGKVSSLSNQFLGYCWGLELNNVLVNKVGFQKTLSPSERFTREIMSYSQARIDEWVEQAVYWFQYLDHCLNSEYFPPNFTSCDKYGGCIFSGSTVGPGVCEHDPESRSWAVEKDFKRGDVWDVGKELTKV